MRQIGLVTAADDRRAVVSVRRMSACEGCHKANPGMNTDGEVTYTSCHECSMFPVEEEMRVDAINEVGAQTGERVVIESSTELILGYAAAVFFLPILAAFVLGCAGAVLLPGQTWAAAVGAVLGFAAAFAVDRLVLDRRAKEKTVYTIVKRLTKGSINPDAVQNMEN